MSVGLLLLSSLFLWNIQEFFSLFFFALSDVVKIGYCLFLFPLSCTTCKYVHAHLSAHMRTHRNLFYIWRDNDLNPILISVGIQARKKVLQCYFFGRGKGEWINFFSYAQIIQLPLCLNIVCVAENLALLLKSKRRGGLCVLELQSRAPARHARFASSARVILLRLEECMGNRGLPQHPVSIMSFGPLPQKRRNFILHL